MDSVFKEVPLLNGNKQPRSKSEGNLSLLQQPLKAFHHEEKNRFPHFFAILPSENNIVQTVVLAEWDNIVGPKARFIWTQEKLEDSVKVDSMTRLPPSQIQTAIKYSVKHTLHGELGNDYSSGQIYDKLFFVSDQGFLIVSAIFSSRSVEIDETDQGLAVPHSLSVVVPFEELEYYLSLHPFCLDWMHCAISRIRIVIHKEDEMVVLATLSNSITEFCLVLQSLKCAAVVKPIISWEDENVPTCLNQLEKFPIKFLELAISSHLQTQGCSVIIGIESAEVNLLVEILTLLLDPKEQKCCRRVHEDKPWPYTSGLLVQGILKDDFGEASISSHDLMCSRYPTTLIDVNLCKVRQSGLYHEHLLQRRKALKQELYSLWRGTKLPSSQFDLHSLFTVVSDAGSLVKTFLSELLAVSWSDNKRLMLVSQFQRQLEYRAFTLIKCCEKLQTGRNFPNRFTCKILSKMLVLEDEDFKIVLAVAEKLKPGLYATLTSNSVLYTVM